jgi:integrase
MSKGLFKRGGIWWMRYSCHGRRYRESCKTPNKKIAQQILDHLQVQIALGKYQVSLKPDITFRTFSDIYVNRHAQFERRLWFKTAHYSVTRFLVPYFGDMKLSAISLNEVGRYKELRRTATSKRGTPYCPATINKELSILQGMLSKAVEWGHLTNNPIQGNGKVMIRRGIKKRIRYLSPEEFKRLMGESSDGLKNIVLVALNTGMRKAEIQKLDWERDVDHHLNLVHIRDAKSGYDEVVPMNEVTKRILSKKFKVNFNWKKAFTSALKRAKIIDFRFHDLRHTFATWLISGGVDIITVKELMRHRDIKTTMRYLHVVKRNVNMAVKKLEDSTKLAQFDENGLPDTQEEVEVIPYLPSSCNNICGSSSIGRAQPCQG